MRYKAYSSGNGTSADYNIGQDAIADAQLQAQRVRSIELRRGQSTPDRSHYLVRPSPLTVYPLSEVDSSVCGDWDNLNQWKPLTDLDTPLNEAVILAKHIASFGNHYNPEEVDNACHRISRHTR